MKIIYIIISDILVFILELISSLICISRKYKIDTKLQKIEYYKNKFTPYIIKYQVLGGIR